MLTIFRPVVKKEWPGRLLHGDVEIAVEPHGEDRWQFFRVPLPFKLEVFRRLY